jgi:hypothetical protein
MISVLSNIWSSVRLKIPKFQAFWQHRYVYIGYDVKRKQYIYTNMYMIQRIIKTSIIRTYWQCSCGQTFCESKETFIVELKFFLLFVNICLTCDINIKREAWYLKIHRISMLPLFLRLGFLNFSDSVVFILCFPIFRIYINYDTS